MYVIINKDVVEMVNPAGETAWCILMDSINGISQTSVETVYEYFIDQFVEYNDDKCNGDLLVQTSSNNAGKLIYQPTILIQFLILVLRNL